MPRNGVATSYAEYEDDESDHDEIDEDAFQDRKRGGNAGKKPADKSSSNRKAQNRQAQREFRQRRLAYVRDLETRVQILSSPHDDQVNTMRNALCALIEENKQLRRLCATLGGFIGNQTTRALENTGMTQVDLEAVLGRGETDTMHDSFTKSAEQYNLTPLDHVFDQTPPGTAGSSMRPPTADGRTSPSSKRKRSSEPSLSMGGSQPQHQPDNRRASVQVPDRSGSASVPPHTYGHPMHPQLPLPQYQHRPEPSFYASPYAVTGDMSGYDSRIWQHADPFVGSALPSPATTDPNEVTQAFTQAAYAPVNGAYAGKLNLPSGRTRQTPQPLDYNGHPPQQRQQQQQATSVEHLLQQGAGAQASPLLMQAVQLIGYHLANRRANPSYPLPNSLLPTAMQASVPHDKLVDGLIWPSMRDRLVVAQDRYDVRELLAALLEHVEIHSEDVMDPANWEIKEPFIRAYASIIDDGIVEQANRWRRQRGEADINPEDLSERPDPPRSKSY